MVNQKTLEEKTWDAVRKTINKFRENPYYFFTESDIHSYFYYCMYNSTFEVNRDNRRIYLVHREYPTNFRYIKKDLSNPDSNISKYYPLDGSIGRRGNYDMAVINPDFADNATNINHIINKNIKDLIVRNNNSDSNDKELLFAIEFKYIISNSIDWVNQVALDNKKLEFALENGAKEAINLVFCNTDYYKYKEELDKVISSPGKVKTILVQTYYDKETDIKELPRLLSNNQSEFEKKGITAF
jgi:hypothetical protein